MPEIMKRLIEQVTSSYIEAANRMTAKGARRRIVAYVESYDDIFFWRMVLGRFENNERYFEVMLPVRARHLERGKKAVLMSLVGENVGRDMIACVDADYDYLLQGASPVSKRITESRYVLHTYAYAIENMQCYAPSLHDVCVGVTLNDRSVFDIDEFMRQYSQAIFPLFVWSIWHYRNNCYGDFSISDFLKSIDLGKYSLKTTDAVLQHLRQKVARKCDAMRRRHPDAKAGYLAGKEDIKRLGVTADTTYLYIQGHHLFDRVVVPLLEKVCQTLVRERQNEISSQSLHGTQRRNELSCYAKSVSDVTTILKRNSGYLQSEPFARIVKDVERMFAEE